MDKRKMSIAVLTVVAVSLVVTFAAASSLMANTPLYTFRMEQASSEMNFLPTAVNGFTYTAENGYTVNCEGSRYSGDVIPFEPTYAWTCIFSTCRNTCETCPYTCDDPTCPNTCPVTCPETCDGWTCDPTGCQATCYTCERTCWDTCEGDTCWPPCP